MVCSTLKWLYHAGPAIAEWLPLIALGTYLLLTYWESNRKGVGSIILLSPLVSVGFCMILFLSLASQYERDFSRYSIDPGIYGYSYRDSNRLCCGCK